MKKGFLISIFLLAFFTSNAQIAENTIENGNAKIHYAIVGQGKPMLMLVGGPGFSYDYLIPVALELSKNFKCILIDARGEGKSVVPIYDSTNVNIALTMGDFEYLRRSLGIDNWIVFGHSVGGMLASIYAVYFPKSVSGLILVGSGGLNSDLWQYYGDNIGCRLLPSDKERTAYWSDSSIYANNPAKAEIEVLKAIGPAFFYDRKNSLLVTEKFDYKTYSPDASRLISADQLKYDVTERSKSFEKPVLVIQGRQDQVGESIPQILSRTYPNSKLVFINKCGHFPWIEQPKEFYDSILSYFHKL
jgi:proline iminopeptidase